MAGGIGSRFWPMSTEEKPKQFLDVLGTGKTLIQMTVERLVRIAPEDQIFVMTNERYAQLVHQQTGLPFNQILTEPERKNTAPCIAYAAHKIYGLNPDANLVVAPSDHLILKEEVFQEIIETALEKSAEGDKIVTLGIQPSRPDTGYGYIQFENNDNATLGTVHKVKKFTEKPDHEKAEQFLASGDFYWNSGIFIWKAETVINALKLFKPELNTLFTTQGNDYNTESEKAFIDKAFRNCENISVDYAILEPAQNVYVVLSEFGWSDLGTWGSLYTHLEKDQNGNAVIGKGVHVFESKGNIVNLPDGKTAILQGLEDYIIVEANNTLLIVKKKDEQKIKEFLKHIP